MGTLLLPPLPTKETQISGKQNLFKKFRDNSIIVKISFLQLGTIVTFVASSKVVISPSFRPLFRETEERSNSSLG